MSTNPRQLGKYELQERLGRGGMGEVRKAFDSQLKRHVAIKLLRADLLADPSFVARFEREAQVIASLQHPNIVQIYDFNVSRPPESESPTPYMVMKYVEGQTLADLIRRTSRKGDFPSPATIVQLFTPISLAIDYAHQKGMIHRDIKPANILLDGRNTSQHSMGEPILSDFGIVKLLGTTGSLSGLWMGTPHYTSPEQVMGAPGNERSDIYSLGVILYEICTGVLPFQGSTPSEIMMQHINTNPPAPMLINPGIPPALTGVILRALAKDPAARFPSASAMVVALAEAFDMPIPQALNATGNPTEVMYSPTHLAPLSPRPPSGGMSHSGSVSVASHPKPLPPPSMPLPPVVAAPARGPDSSGSFLGPNVPGLPPSSAQPPPTAALPQSASRVLPGPITPWPTAPASPPVARKRRRWLIVGLTVVSILVLVSSGLGAFLLGRGSVIRSTPTSTFPFVPQPIIGHAFFISSGHISEFSNHGIMDELQIELSGVPNPPPGKSYYAWLQPDLFQTITTPTIISGPLLLGAWSVTNGRIASLYPGDVSVTKGQIVLFYPGDAQHTNLLASRSSLLITEENTEDPPPSVPSPNISTWRYAAQLWSVFRRSPTFRQNTPTPTSGRGTFPLTAVDYLRYLLADEGPELKAAGLTGGLDIWLFRNTEKILEWSVSARDDWGQIQNSALLHRNIVRILDYLDGLSFVQQDAPGEPVGVTPMDGQIGLLDADPSMVTHGFLYTIDAYLNALVQSPRSTPAQHNLAMQIDIAVRNVETLLARVRKDAQQLEALSPAQLTQTTTLEDLLDPMSDAALSAFAGFINPVNGNVQYGVVQIHYDIQRLATFDIHLVSGNCVSSFCPRT
jgi:eukaryotic-like serine/threonine-protein kinase